uniref:DUF659 domain-containing protein n=1 Tax=Lactuca sativa TaxID=4236 RepID=A0A9R1VBV0_LACSA|nr:hypothetical protein LSAT_V11C500294590 [Lactuca sativa]
MHELRTWILQEEVKTTTIMADGIKATWKTIEVSLLSLLSDGWLDMRNRSLINFLVNNQYVTVFFRTIDASYCIKMLKKNLIVEEIREDIVVQVVSNNASAYKSVGSLLMEKRKKKETCIGPHVQLTASI